MTTKQMTVDKARGILDQLDMTLRTYGGEYRVNYRGGLEATAYYTNDIMDAVQTGVRMKEELVAKVKAAI